MKYFDTYDFGSVPIANSSSEEIVRHISYRLEQKLGGYLSVCATYTAVLGNLSSRMSKVLNDSAYNFPDGKPLAILNPNRIKRNSTRGTEILRQVLSSTSSTNFSHFFLGSTSSTTDLLLNKINTKFPNAKIIGAFNPPFSQLKDFDTTGISNYIKELKPSIVWIGLGSPKQEVFASILSPEIPETLFITIGAAFDFLAGTKKEVPVFLRNSGFEWLFRLIKEPKRLFLRYFFGNMIYIFIYLTNKFGTMLVKNSDLDSNTNKIHI